MRSLGACIIVGAVNGLFGSASHREQEGHGALGSVVVAAFVEAGGTVYRQS